MKNFTKSISNKDSTPLFTLTVLAAIAIMYVAMFYIVPHISISFFDSLKAFTEAYYNSELVTSSESNFFTPILNIIFNETLWRWVGVFVCYGSVMAFFGCMYRVEDEE